MRDQMTVARPMTTRARPINRPAPVRWSKEDSEAVAYAGGCCLLSVLVILFLFGPYIVWGIGWLLAGRPDVTSNWNAWNISLRVIIAIQGFGGGAKASSR